MLRSLREIRGGRWPTLMTTGGLVMARPTKVIVGPNQGAPGWAVSIEGSHKVLTGIGTKLDAIRLGRGELVRLGGGELEIRRRNGSVQEARTIGVPENRGSAG